MRNGTNAVGAVVFAVLMVTSLFAGTVAVSAVPTEGTESAPAALSITNAPATLPPGPFSTQNSATGSEQLLGAERTYEVTNSGQSYYNLDGYEQPSITLVRGKTYTFNVDASGHPFHISTDSNGGDFSGIYTDGVSVTTPSSANDNATETGTLTFTVPLDAPNTLYYQCGFHSGMGATITVVDPGDGSAANPYVITNASELQDMNTDLDASYVLGNDIDASGIANFDPIGDATNLFTGSFDGDGYTISNLTIDRPTEDDVGLFGSTSQTTTVKHISLDNVNITGARTVGALAGAFSGGKIVSASASGQVSGTDKIGGLVGKVGDRSTNGEGNITDSHASVKVHAEILKAGGLVGQIERGNVTDSTASGAVNADLDTAGGLVGVFITAGAAKTYIIANSSASGAVNAESDGGGLVGVTRKSIIRNSSASGTIVVDEGKAGGLVSVMLDGSDVIDSSAMGDVNATENFVGGLVGRVASGGGAPPNITDSDASGEVTVTGGGGFTSAESIGGLVGGVESGSVTGSHASGDVTLVAGSGSGTFAQVGGLIGSFGTTGFGSSSFDGTLVNSSASGNVTGPKTVGGLVGVSAGTITDSYASGDVVGNGDGSLGLDGRRKGNNTFGGLVGSAPVGTIVNSNATGDVAAGQTVGGLVGSLGSFDGTATVVNSTAAGAVTGSQLVGGLAGSISQGSVSNSAALGSVTGNRTVGGLVGSNRDQITGSYATTTVSGQDGVGGLVGSNSGNLSTSYATATVSGQDGVGGLVGSNSGNLSTSYATATVSGQNRVGGLAGFNTGNVSISYATANASGTSFVGGLVGGNHGVIAQTYAAGKVTGSQSTGGLVGDASALDLGRNQLPAGTTITSYWDTETTGKKTSAGNATRLTTNQLKGDAAKTNTVFDFTTIWGVVDNTTDVSYPFLQANPQIPAPVPGPRSDSTSPTPDSNTANDESPTDTESTTAATNNRDDDDDDDRRSSRSRSGGSSGPTVSVSVTSTPGSDSAGDSTDENGETATDDIDGTDDTDDTDDADDTDDQRPDTPAGKSVSVRGVGSGQTVGIDLSTDTDESESEADTEDAADDTQPTESEPVRRNVIPDALDIAFKRSGDYGLVVTSRDIDVFAQAVETPGTAGDAETDGDAQPDSGVDEDTSPPVPDLSTDALDEDSKRFVSETNQRPVGFIEVDTKFDSSDVVEQATHKFRVRKSYLEATGASVDSVRLYRDEVDQWRPLPTRQTTEDDEFYYFEADTPGFSVFAIGTSSPVFDATSPVVESFDETTGTVEASVTVENVGSAPGEFTVPLVANDETIGSETASIDDGETASMTVSGVIDDPETVSLRIADRPLGELTAALPSEQSPEATAESTVGDDASTDAGSSEDADDQVRNEIEATELEDPSSSLDILGILVPIGALGLVLFFILWRRRDDEEDEDREDDKDVTVVADDEVGDIGEEGLDDEPGE